MRRIERTNAFKRDYKRIKATPKHRNIDNLVPEVLHLLKTDTPLPPKYCDHPLTGEWKDHRDCHIKPDVVLIYRKPEAEVLQLVRLGSHSELGL
jgi:mRNA interferase YafQ